MRLVSTRSVVTGMLLVLATPAFAYPRVHRGPTAPRLFKARPVTVRPPRVSGIEPERAAQIQTALIKAGYLTGAPTGTWDNTTQAAMEKLQADNGWQTKLVPDSRAIIKLGLGPGSAPPAPFTLATERPEAAAEEAVPAGVPSNQ